MKERGRWWYLLVAIPLVWGLLTEPLIVIGALAVTMGFCLIAFAILAWLSKR